MANILKERRSRLVRHGGHQPFAPKINEEIFMGYYFSSDGEWKGDYEVLVLYPTRSCERRKARERERDA